MRDHSRRLPFPDLLLLYVFLIILFCGIIPPIRLLRENKYYLLFTIIDFTIIFLILVLTVLSHTAYWNVPLLINKQGITKRTGKKKKLFLWEKAIDMRIIHPFLLKIWILEISYEDNTKIRFELYRIIEKDIFYYCKDENFIEMLKNQINIRYTR